MNNRRIFLAALATGGIGLTLAAQPGNAQSPAPASPAPAAPQPSAPSGGAPSSPKPPSPASRSIAEGMRSFDPSLTDDQVALIARRIEGNRAVGAAFNPKDHPLRNGDEPITRFAVPLPGRAG